MTGAELREVESIAASVRAKIGCDPEDVRAMCFEATQALGAALKKAGFRPVRVRGTFLIDDPNPEFTPEEAFESGEAWTPIHHWIEVDGWIVDVTAVQFNEEIEEPMPEVVVGRARDLKRYRALKRTAVRR